MSKIVCYIPNDTTNSEKKKARKKLQELKNTGYEVEEINTLDDLLKCETGSRYLVKITCDVLRIRKKATTLSAITGKVKKNEVYTITETRNGWGKLKSGVGWICLKHTERMI